MQKNKELENDKKLHNEAILKDKIKAKMKKYEWAIKHYDCDEADYIQSQDLGSWYVLQKLLEEE